MTVPTRLRFAMLATLALAALAPPAGAQGFEVWLVDQSNSPGRTYGGRILVYEGSQLMGERPEQSPPTATIDLGDATASLCLAETGANPVRPHMLVFNSTDTHAALTFAASGHVVFFDARSREPLTCLRMSLGAGGARQAHAAWPTPDDRALLVANQNGKLFERIWTDYATNAFTLDTAATLDLANCTTPNGVACQGALRPDNAPISPFVASDNGPAFVSLRGGGLFVVDHSQTPMRIVGEYDNTAIAANGYGMIEAGGKVFLNAGGGTLTNLFQFRVYRLPMSGYEALNAPNTPTPEILYVSDGPDRDAHGVAVSRQERYAWMFDRAANNALVFDTVDGALVNTVDLVSPASADPTPDLVASSPWGNRFFASLRGPNPLTGDPHTATGSTPGLGIIHVAGGGRSGRLIAVVPITNVDEGGIERADAHGIRVRLTGPPK